MNYTRDDANALIAEVRSRLESLRETHARVAVRVEEISKLSRGNGHGEDVASMQKDTRELAEELAWFEEKEIIVRDPVEGLIDFPAERDGKDIYLCWKLGEDGVDFWHDTDTGFAGRQPL